jgi:SagB-type dehydrogenase family enzyme
MVTTPWLRAAAAVALLGVLGLAPAAAPPPVGETLELPPPLRTGPIALETALGQRRSVRAFAATPLTLAQAAQLLWAAQGESAEGRRTAPSAGATYPLSLYLLAGAVDGLAPGIWRYHPGTHALQRVADRDIRPAIAAAALGQRWMAQAPALVIVAAQPARTGARYGARAERYVALEAGAAMQNLLLQATALGLAGTPVGAFDDAALRRALPLAEGEQPLLALPVGSAR